MNSLASLNHRANARIKTQIWDSATNTLVSESGWQNNLLFDVGLNNMANSLGTGPLGIANIFEELKLGSGTTSNSVASGSITFTQAGTLVTASGSFFTAGMVGAILKYGTGTGGAEVYIVSQAGTTAVVSISLTQIATVGTVWLVQQTALVTSLGINTTTIINASSANTAFSTNTVNLTRTFKFAVQGSTYSVNEIGYCNSGLSSGNVLGRIVLSSTDSITSSQFYVVIFQMLYTVSPGTPTAVSNIGSGINTAGTAAFQYWDFTALSFTTGASTPWQATPSNLMDKCVGTGSFGFMGLTGTAPTLNTNPSTSFNPATTANSLVLGTFSGMVFRSGNVGIGDCTCAFSQTTAAQVLNSLMFGNSNSVSPGTAGSTLPTFFINLTTPFVLPTGTFSGSAVFTNVFTRQLTN